FNPSRRNPEHPRRRDGINSPSLPPCDFVSEAMDVAVMDPTERYRELIAYFQSHRAGLGEPQMMGVGGTSPTDQTGLRCNKFKMGLVAEPTRLANCEYAFIDLARSGGVLSVC